MITAARLDRAEARAAAPKLRPLTPVQIAQATNIEPDPWQRDVLQSNADRILMNCSRQTGKSTLAGILSVAGSVYEPESLILLLSPSLRQSGELFKKAVGVYRDLGRPVAPESETALTLTLENGSRIVSLPGKDGTIRGYSGVKLLVIDEASRVPDDLYKAVRPMLAVSGGRLIGMSSPWGRRGWFYEAWVSGERWERYEVPATVCPRITAEFLEEERAALGESIYAQEYLCSFEATTDTVFSFDFISKLHDDTILPLFGAA